MPGRVKRKVFGDSSHLADADKLFVDRGVAFDVKEVREIVEMAMLYFPGFPLCKIRCV